ncbi:MAG: DUF5615 family PIN-like protein [Chloroflexi bacterium]|nr:DUF5615 family PIN-like protein [Chloroflexota bacterium]
MRFFLDEHLSRKIAEIARSHSVDVVSCQESGRIGLSDEEQLGLAGAEGRCVVTGNARHFIPLTVEFFANQWPHAGVLIVPLPVPEDAFSAVARALADYDRAHPQGPSANGIDFLSLQ